MSPLRIASLISAAVTFGLALAMYLTGDEVGASEESNPGMGTSHDARPPQESLA